MNRYTVITMMIIIILNNAKEVLACPSQTSNIDIHDLLKQKQMLNGGKQALANQKVTALLPVHHQIQQEVQSIKEFVIIVIIANTISNLLLIGITQCCSSGIRYMAKVTLEIDNLRNWDEKDRECETYRRSSMRS